MEEIERFPSQKSDCDKKDDNCQQFTKIKSSARVFMLPGRHAQNVQRGKPENQCPYDVEDVLLMGP
ncbi:MAG: hypothetical protein ABSE92_00360 [Terriglobales bacterium]